MSLISVCLLLIDFSFLPACCSECILFLSFFEILFYFYAYTPANIFYFPIYVYCSSVLLVFKSWTLWVIFISDGSNEFTAWESEIIFLGFYFFTFSCYVRAYFLSEYSSVISISLIANFYNSKDNSFTKFCVAISTWGKANLEILWVTFVPSFYVLFILLFLTNSSASRSSGIFICSVFGCSCFFY